MELLANDRSIHGQFPDVKSFLDAFTLLMNMRKVAKRFGREVHCNLEFMNTEPVQGISTQKAFGRFSDNERRAAMIWLTQAGPFWDEHRLHGASDWLECRGNIITNSAIGEAAYRTLKGIECNLLSLIPSDWDYSPVNVLWRRGEAEGIDDQRVALENWRDSYALKATLIEASPPIESWKGLRNISRERFKSLIFARNCYDHLDGFPFAPSSANRILELLNVLDRLACAFDADGCRTPEGRQIYRDCFTGERAWFSDSSASEKRNFRNELTFPHPNDSSKSLFCTWHGKVSHMNLRLHYSWSAKANQPVYVVYIGPKITKQ